MAQLSAAEFRSWQSYAQLEPFGQHYDDLRAGSIVAAIYNVNRDPKKQTEPFGPLVFTPWNEMAQRQAEPRTLPNAAAEDAALLSAFGIDPSNPVPVVHPEI